MAVRLREWTTKKGVHCTAWILDYRDADGARRQETFKLKKDAKAREAEIVTDIKGGVHVPRTVSIDVAKAVDNWLKLCEQNGLERGTLEQYQSLARLHILPLLARTKLADLTSPSVHKFERALYARGVSDAMRRKVITALSSALRVATFQGFINRNVADGFKVRTDKRGRRKLRVGVDVPTNDEVNEFLATLPRKARPMFAVAVYAGLRASELRGLRWCNVDLDNRVIHVVERADKFNALGPTKSESGQRSIPIGARLTSELYLWKRLCPASAIGLVFPNSKGRTQSLSNLRKRVLIPAMLKAGLVNEEGDAKYGGMHCLRHFHASYLMNPSEHGGLGLPLKVVSERLGHSSIALTADRYGHLMPAVDYRESLDEAERGLAQLVAA